MIVSCTNCETKYRADDSKVVNKKFAFTCPNCETEVIIDNRESTEEEISLTDQPASEEMEIQDEGMDDIADETIAFEDTEIDTADEDLTISEEDTELTLSEETLPGEDILEDGPLELEGEGEDSSFTMDSEEELIIPEDEETIQPYEDITEGDELDSIELNLDNIAAEDEIAEPGDTDETPAEAMVSRDLDFGLDESEEEQSLDEVDIRADDTEELNFIEVPDEPDAAEEDLNIEELSAESLSFEEESEPAALDAAVDIPIEEGDMEQVEEKITVDDVKSDELFSQESADMDSEEDTDITIDLDSLDIQLEEIEGEAEMLTGEGINEEIDLDALEGIEEIGGEEPVEIPVEAEDTEDAMEGSKDEEEDEDLTLDLDSLDLNLDETEETMEGEAVDDERLSLADAGLTPDELFEEELSRVAEEAEDDELRINISEVSAEPGKEGGEELDEMSISMDEEIPDEDELNLLPESDIEPDFTAEPQTGDISFEEEAIEVPVGAGEEDELIELPEIDLDAFEKSEMEMEELGEIEPVQDMELSEDRKIASPRPQHDIKIKEIEDIKEDVYDTVPGGAVNFSVDYSLNFSRIGALLRLSGLFLIGLLPSLIISVVYIALSLVLAFINWILIILTGESVDDYTEIQENTLRRILSFGACYMDIVEELPLYSGRKDIDYPLQYEVTYPLRYSRILAALRLSVVGIVLITLPHILMLAILSIGSIPICIAGLFSVLIKKTWPNILFDSIVKYWNYASNVLSYLIGLVDKYPKFKFE